MYGGLLGRARPAVSLLAAIATLAVAAFLAVADPAAPAVTCDRVADASAGSDGNDGTTASPWRTAQKLVDNLAPGQTGCLRGGRFREDVTISGSGTSSARITVRSAPGQVATVEGRLLVSGDNVTVSQLVLDGHLATGGFGQVVEGEDVVFTDNNVTSGATASCFKLGTATARPLRTQITRNRIHNCKTGVLVSAASHPAILRNLIYDNVDRGIRLEPDATGAYVLRNVIDNNGEGVFLGGSGATVPTSNAIHRNAISNSNMRWNIGSTVPDGSGDGYNHVWRNCLYATNVDAAFNTTGGIEPASSTRGFTVYDASLVIGDPLYVNPEAGNYRMGSESPCLQTTGDTAALLTGANAAPPDSAVPIRKPNVLIFLTDDQRTEGTLEAMPKTRKWFLSGGTDAGDLTAGGTWFPQAIGTTPLCCPGRTSLFSGLYSHNTLIQHNCCVEEVFDQDHTIQAYLGRPAAGYDRGIFGRYMHWNIWLDPPFWDKWSIAHGGSYFAPDVNEQGTRRAAATAPRQYSTSYFRDQTLSFVDGQETLDAKPWLAQMSPYAPHLPATPDTQYDANNYPASNFPAYQQTPAQQETDLSDKPPYVQQWADSQNVFGTNPEGSRIRQLRSLKSVDDAVDDVFSRLEQTGEAADTLAFYMSDNGNLWREHGLTNKSKPYLDSIRVPLMMRWPANPKVRRNSIDQRLVANIDVAPTVMQAAGVATDPGKPMDGVSLLDRSRQRDRLLAEYWGDLNAGPDEESGAVAAGTQALPKWKVPPWASILTRDYQYIEYYDDEGTQPTFREFYDLRPGHDPYELTNLYGSDGDPSNDPPTQPTAAALSAQLAKDRLCSGADCPPGAGAPTAIDQAPPKMLLKSPVNGHVVNQHVEVAPNTWDNRGVQSVSYRLDGNQLAPDQTSQPWGITWDTTTATNGQHTLTVISRDASGNATQVDVPVTVDNGGIDVQTTNGGPTAGFEETGDTIVYSFGTAMDPASILPGWNGSATSVTVKLNPDDALNQYHDSLVIQQPDGTAIAPLGVVDLGTANYVGLFEPGGRFTGSTMTMAPNGSSITVVLGTPNPLLATPALTPGSMTWATSSLARKVGGQPFCSCKVLEGIPTGSSPDREF